MDYDYDIDIEEIDEEYIEYLLDDAPENTLKNTLLTCAIPSLIQAGSNILAMLACSFLSRLLSVIASNSGIKKYRLQHLISMACGFAALYFTIGEVFLIVLFITLIAYILMLMLEYYKSCNMGLILAATIISSQFICEVFWKEPETWQRVRGTQMVATMKIVSFAFDFNQPACSKEKIPNRVPALVPYLGYIFCPASCLIGPWISYKSYMSTLDIRSFKLSWVLWTVLNTGLALVLLCLSDCIVPWVCSDCTWKWLLPYCGALSVRCNHYFICFLSQAISSAGGVPIDAAEYNSLLGFMITKPLSIEFPRSLAALVRKWNIPMHYWLKTYIFQATKARFKSYLAAILLTYLVSSFLHGFFLRIYLVLLSLAVFAYVESITRSKLAYIFDACISSTPCRKPCKYTYCSSHGVWEKSSICVLIANTFFSLLTVFLLAYLGVMMSDNDMEEERWNVSLSKWSTLNYSGHFIALIYYAFYYFV